MKRAYDATKANQQTGYGVRRLELIDARVIAAGAPVKLAILSESEPLQNAVDILTVST